MNQKQSLYLFSVLDLDKQPVDLSKYTNKVVLVVNTASACGLTSQLGQLEELYQKFNNRDFEILAFPSNDFAGQEPLDGQAIQSFCALNYQATYPVFDKIHVKGSAAHPLFKHLAKATNSKPRWNFHKYLINKEGVAVDYFMPFTKPNQSKVVRAIERLLEAI